MSTRRRLLVLALGIAAGCGGGGPTSPIISGGGTSGSVNVTGVWSGPASDALGQFQMTLRLTQTGNTVTGTMTATTPVGAPLYSNGTLTGSVADNTFSFSIQVPRGGIADAPDCTASFAGSTNDLLSSSMSGTYTGGDTCGDTFVGGRFQLLKQ